MTKLRKKAKIIECFLLDKFRFVEIYSIEIFYFGRNLLCMKKVLCTIFIVLFVVILVGCGNDDNGKKVMNINYITLDDGTSAKKYDGQAQEFFNVTDTEPQAVKVTVNKISGELEIKIFNSEDETNMVYEGHDFPTDSFTVNVTDSGRYTILVTCKDFIGEYSFDYNLRVN